MSVSFQALLGDTSIDANTINVDELDANTIRVAAGGGLVVMGDTILHDLLIPDGAQDGFVLTSDLVGNASWQPAIQNVTLAGDVVGESNANTVALVGGSTAVAVNDTVQNRKYVGFWNAATAYKAGNQVSYNYNVFNCNSDNTNSNPEFSNTQIQFYTDAIIPGVSSNGTNVELGHAFTTAVEGFITGIRFYKFASTTLTSRKMSIWNFTTGATIGSLTTVGERTTAGWVTATLPVPVYIAPGTSYLVSRSHTAGAYSTVNGFSQANQSQGLTISLGWSGSIGSLPISQTTFNYFSDVIFQPKEANTNWARVVSGIDETERSLIRAAYEPVVNATRLNQGSRIVRRDPSGNFFAGTITASLTGNVTGNLTGNASTATTATTATNFTGSLVGDVTGTQGATFVSNIQGQPISNYVTLNSVQILTNKNLLTGSNSIAATHLRPVNNGTQWTGGALPILNNQTLTSGQVLTYTGASGGDGYFQFENASSGSATLVGDVTGTVGANTVALVGGQTAANVAAGTVLANNATSTSTANAIVRRDASGNFSADTITANLTGIASDVTNSAVIGKVLTGFTAGAGTVTSADSILTAFQKTTGNLTNISTIVNNGTSGVVPNTLVLRNGLADTAVRDLLLRRLVSGSTGSAIVDIDNASSNCFVGDSAGNQNASIGGLNTFVGKLCGQALTTGSDNCALGYACMRNIRGGLYNVGMGSSTMFATTTGSNNTGLGYATLGGLTTASSCTAVGSTALTKITTSANCTAVGRGALFELISTASTDCTAIGFNAGNLSLGTQCTFLGSTADSATSVNYSNSTAVGFGAKVTASNQMQLGNASVTVVRTSGAVNSASLTTTGAIQAGTTLNATGAIGGNTTVTAQQTLISRSYTAPTFQGAHIGWNRDGGSGRMMFGNQRGGGIGGFEWIHFDFVNALIAPTPTMLLDINGNLSIPGSFTPTGQVVSTPAIYTGLLSSDEVRTVPVSISTVAVPLQSFSSSGVTSASTSGFTVVHSGMYRISIMMRISLAAVRDIYVSFRKNGGDVDGGRISSFSPGSTDSMLNGTSVISLNAGDVVTFVAFTLGSSVSTTFRAGGSYPGSCTLSVERIN